MNENICVRLIVSETTWVHQEWVIVQTFQDTHEVLMPQLSSYPFLSVSSAPSAFPSSFLRSHQELSTSASRCLRSNMFSSFVSVFTTFNRFSSTFMTDSSFVMSVFFSSLRFTGSSGGGTNVIGRFGDFAINRRFTNTFSCVSVRFSLRLELDITAVSGSGSVSPSIS